MCWLSAVLSVSVVLIESIGWLVQVVVVVAVSGIYISNNMVSSSLSR